jgi:hypothetical protein
MPPDEPLPIDDDPLPDPIADDPIEEDDVTDPAGEPEDEPSDEPGVSALGDPAPGHAAQQQPSRREDRIRTLVEENRRYGSELADTRRRLDELTMRLATPQPQQETQEQRAARLSLMPPEDRLREEFREDSQRHRQEMHQMAFQVRDSSDRSAYQARAAVDQYYRKWENKVEQELADLRKTGVNIEREKLLAYLVGKSYLEARLSPKARKQVEAAERRVAAQRVRTADNRSDVQPQRSRASESLEKRLENVII